MRALKSFPSKRLFSRPFASPLTTFSTPVNELNRRYHKSLQIALVASLVVSIAFLQFLPKRIQLARSQEVDHFELILEDVPPPTKQLAQLPPPPRPMVPIPSDDDDIPEDLTIAETELDFDELLPPPPPPPVESEGDTYMFIAYDSPPEIIGGIASLQKYLQYPTVARLAGVEGRVIVGALIDESGECIKIQILKQSGTNVGFEEAAQTAVMKLEWIPARQRDKPKKVWFSIPVSFLLVGS